MIKFKIVGIFNILFAILQLVIAVIYPFYVFPYMNSLYSSFNVEYNVNSPFVYAVIISAFILAILNIVVGLNEFGLQKEKYFNFSIVLIALSFLSMSLLVGGMVSVFILPIYNLNSQL